MCRWTDPGYRFASASHAWIALHRLVEAFCRLTGNSFGAVFAELEARFDFARAEPGRWPDPPTMRRAADWLRGAREEVLAARNALIAARRAAKALGRRTPVPAELDRSEARIRAYAAALPRVGHWGWKRRRERGQWQAR